MGPLDYDKLPQHIAIIMDGNGRWAKHRGKKRVFGHQQGVKAVQKIVEEAARLKVPYLTLFAFSTENWNRPKEEIGTLMKLLVRSLREELEKMLKNNIRLTTIGATDRLPNQVQKELELVVKKTKNNSNMVLTLALSYGGREEIQRATREIAVLVKNNIISPEKIDESIINRHLYAQNLPDVDLLIRTSGEQRISNFMLWHLAYAELYFTSTCWPDFDEKELHAALLNYQNRERRFGKTSEQVNP
ncbi:MAG: isoprenyl transferase [Flavobacteriaceae bacterium]